MIKSRKIVYIYLGGAAYIYLGGAEETNINLHVLQSNLFFVDYKLKQ